MNLGDHGITYFNLKELVHPHPYKKYGANRCLQFLDLRVFKAWNWIREQRGNPIYMNTWGINTPKWYPEFDDRGLRWLGESDTGSRTSQHMYGRAGDGDELGTSARDLYNWIMERQDQMLEFGVTTIENIEFTRTWIHLDCRNWPFYHNELVVVSP